MRQLGVCGSVFLFATTALAPITMAQAAECSATDAVPLQIGAAVDVPANEPVTYSFELQSGEGAIMDLSSVSQSDAADEASEAAAPSGRMLALCNAAGRVVAPQPGEVFEKGGSVVSTPDGERLRFVAPETDTYTLTVSARDEACELIVRRRDLGPAATTVAAASLGSVQRGKVSSAQPQVYSFAGKAGEWVEIKSTSESDTVLRLAAPDRAGDYSVIGENDDADGLNPVIRRSLPTTGTYYVQVDALSDDEGEYSLALTRISAPKAPVPPATLRIGQSVEGRMADSDSVKLYALSVAPGHSYRVEVNASYDAAIAVGVESALEPDDGGFGPDAGFAELKSQDAGVSGAERLNFTARSAGELLVKVYNFGIDDTDGKYTLSVTDLGS